MSNNLNFLKDFINFIKIPDNAVSNRQYFIVSFDKIPGVYIPDNLSLYVQGFDLPNMVINEDPTIVKNTVGSTNIPSEGFIMPETNIFSIDILETEMPFIEKYIVPWFKQCVSVYNTGLMYPLPRAKVYVDILSSDAMNILYTYIFDGVFPSLIALPVLGQTARQEISRSVTFSFNKTDITWEYATHNMSDMSLKNTIHDVMSKFNSGLNDSLSEFSIEPPVEPIKSQRERLRNYKWSPGEFKIPKPEIIKQDLDIVKDNAELIKNAAESAQDIGNNTIKAIDDAKSIADAVKSAQSTFGNTLNMVKETIEMVDDAAKSVSDTINDSADMVNSTVSTILRAKKAINDTVHDTKDIFKTVKNAKSDLTDNVKRITDFKIDI